MQRLAGGEGGDLQIGASLGTTVNQQISPWPHGQLTRYRREKAARLGLVAAGIDEEYSTRTGVVPVSRCSLTHTQAALSLRGLWRQAASGCQRERHQLRESGLR